MSEARAGSVRGGGADVEASRMRPAAPRGRARWMGGLGDLVAAGVVLLGGGLLGSAVFRGPDLFGPAGVLPVLGPSPAPVSPPAAPFAENLTTIVLLVGPAALMLLRRRWPVPVFAVSLAAFVLAVLFGLPSLGPGIATVIAAYAFAFRAPRTPVLVTVASAVALVVVLAFAATGWHSLDTRVFQVAAAFAIAAALGDSARSRHEYLRQVEDRATRAEQTREAEAQQRVSEERLRIARDLHDTVAHQISVINLHAGAASGYLSGQPERARSALGTIREAARSALGEIGDLLRYLRDGEDAEAVPQQSLVALDALVHRMRAAGLDVEADTRGDLSQVGGTAGTVAYRVVQEGLTNAHKHGGPGVVHLRVTAEPGRIGIEIDNALPGGGSRPRGEASGSGLGLVGLRERVTAAQGTVTTSLSGGRHRLNVELPLQQREGEGEAG